MATVKSLIIVILIGLTACNSADKNTGQLASKDTTKVSLTTVFNVDSSRFVLDTTIVANFGGDTTEQINKTIKLITDFDKTAVNFRTDTFSVYEKTTEGCEIIVAHNRTTDYLKFYGTLYGEMGKSEFSFYTLNGRHPKISCAVFRDISYDKPMYEKDMKVRESKTSYEIYCDNKLIAILDEQKKRQHYSTAELKEKENDTRQFFKEYIGQIKIVK